MSAFYLADVHSELICKCHYTKLFSSLFCVSGLILIFNYSVCCRSLLLFSYQAFIYIFLCPAWFCLLVFFFVLNAFVCRFSAATQICVSCFNHCVCTRRSIGAALHLGEFCISISICYGQYFAQWSVLFIVCM